MIKKYVYNGETYESSWSVKRAIELAERTRFGAEPEGTLEEKQAFWAEHNVAYTEEAEPDPIPPTEEELAAQALREAKIERSRAVREIKVTVDGMTFDGDETAQNRMARAIIAAETAGKDTATWVLADNTVATVTKAQLQQALAQSMLAMEAVWPTPYTESHSVTR